MATEAARKKSFPGMRSIARERVYVDIPKSDRIFFKHLAGKMGWTVSDNNATVQAIEDAVNGNVTECEDFDDYMNKTAIHA
jgi:hypothetical protein